MDWLDLLEFGLGFFFFFFLEEEALEFGLRFLVDDLDALDLLGVILDGAVGEGSDMSSSSSSSSEEDSPGGSFALVLLLLLLLMSFSFHFFSGKWYHD